MNNLELDMLLINWARWAKNPALSLGHCKSLESRYRSPQTWHANEMRPQVDILAAHRVEDAVVKLNPGARMLIVYNFVAPHLNFFQICRKAGVKPHNFDDAYLKARESLQNRLTITK